MIVCPSCSASMPRSKAERRGTAPRAMPVELLQTGHMSPSAAVIPTTNRWLQRGLPLPWFLVSLLVLILVSPTARAEEWSQLVLVSGASMPARVLGFDGEQLTLVGPADREQTLPAESVVRLGSLRNWASKGQILLTDGSILLGRVVTIARSRLEIETEYWGELEIPRSALKGVVWDPPVDPLGQWQLRDRLTENPADRTDSLILKNGDLLSGTFSSSDRTSIQFDAGVGEIELRADLVSAFRSGSQLLEPKASAWTLGLRDGTRLIAERARMGPRLSATLACGVRLETLPEIQPVEEQLVTYLRPANDRVTYLSDLPPLGHKHIPYLTARWGWGADRNVLGGPISSREQLYEKGIGMHSTSRLAFKLPKGYDAFQAEVCLDKSAGDRGSVLFRVYISTAAGTWTEVYRSETIRGGDPPIPVRVDVRGAPGLALVVDFADQGDQLDRANWIGARLVKQAE